MALLRAIIGQLAQPLKELGLGQLIGDYMFSERDCTCKSILHRDLCPDDVAGSCRTCGTLGIDTGNLHDIECKWFTYVSCATPDSCDAFGYHRCNTYAHSMHQGRTLPFAIFGSDWSAHDQLARLTMMHDHEYEEVICKRPMNEVNGRVMLRYVFLYVVMQVRIRRRQAKRFAQALMDATYSR